MGEADKDNEKSELEDFLYGWEYFSMKDVVPKYIEKLFKAFRGEDKGCLNPFGEKIFGFNNGDFVVICSKQTMLRGCQRKQYHMAFPCGFMHNLRMLKILRFFCVVNYKKICYIFLMEESDVSCFL